MPASSAWLALPAHARWLEEEGDRLLDFSRAVTGSLFFVPSATFLEAVQDDEPAVATPSAAMPVAASAADEPSPSPVPPRDGSLGIGSLKGDIRHE